MSTGDPIIRCSMCGENFYAVNGHICRAGAFFSLAPVGTEMSAPVIPPEWSMTKRETDKDAEIARLQAEITRLHQYTEQPIDGGNMSLYQLDVANIERLVQRAETAEAQLTAAQNERDAAIAECRIKIANDLKRRAAELEWQWQTQYRGTGGLSLTDSKNLDTIRELREQAGKIIVTLAAQGTEAQPQDAGEAR